MKVWINDLKKGDVFWVIDHMYTYNLIKCEHLGPSESLEYRMPRIKYKVLEYLFENTNNISSEGELFINQYVYTELDSEAMNDFYKVLNDDKKYYMSKIKLHAREIANAENEINKINNTLKSYENNN